MIRTTVFLSILIGTGAAHAETPALAIRVGTDSRETLSIGADDCTTKLLVQWQYNRMVGSLSSPLKLWATAGECSDEKAGTDDVSYDPVPSSSLAPGASGTFHVDISGLPGFKEGSKTPCGTPNITKAHKICGTVQYTSALGYGSSVSNFPASPLKIIYDTEPPKKPVITDVAALDGAARIGFTVDSDVTEVVPEFRRSDATEFSSAAGVAASAGSVKIGGLVNGITYVIQLRAKDAVGLASDPSASIEATPMHTLGFWGEYRRAGGTEQGGCASAPGLLPVCGAVLVLLKRRRGRRSTLLGASGLAFRPSVSRPDLREPQSDTRRTWTSRKPGGQVLL